MTPVTFPLLKLPLLTFKNVVRSMKMEELFDLSHCSKKTQRYLKACYGKNLHFCVKISGDSHFSFYIKNRYADVLRICLENTIFGFDESKMFDYSTPNRTIRLNRSQAPLQGVMSIISHFFDSFDLEIGELFIDLDSVGIQFCPLIQSIFQRQTVFQEVSIFGSIDREDLKYLLENCTIREHFVTSIKVESPHNLNLNTSLMNFDLAGWLTVPNLLSMDFETAELKKASFQLNDWVAILSAWRNGWNPKMYRLSITSDLEYTSIVNHLPFGTMRENSVVRSAKFYSRFSTFLWGVHVVKGGFDITRDDGKVATVFSVVEDPFVIEMRIWDNQATTN